MRDALRVGSTSNGAPSARPVAIQFRPLTFVLSLGHGLVVNGVVGTNDDVACCRAEERLLNPPTDSAALQVALTMGGGCVPRR